jgi:DUF2934 family protein
MNEDHIRKHAYQLWVEAGCPEGRDEEFWEKGRELAAIEDNQHLAVKPNPVVDRRRDGPWNEPIEPIEAIQNQGDFPGMADQGEEQPRPPHHQKPES